MALATFCTSNIKSLRKPRRKRSVFPSSRKYGIRPHETFAVKSMDINSNLLRLKLDMVYRDVSAEEAQKRYAELTEAPEPPKVAKEPKKVKRKTVKALVPKK